jgi:hypothetical protein
MANKMPALRSATQLLTLMFFVWGWEVLARTLRHICANSRWICDRLSIFDCERETLLVAIGDSLQAVAPLILFAAVSLLVDAAQSYDPYAAAGATDIDAGRASLRRRGRPDGECARGVLHLPVVTKERMHGNA